MPRLSAKISLSMITKIVNDFVVVLREMPRSTLNENAPGTNTSRVLVDIV